MVAIAALVTLAGDAATLLAISVGAYWLGGPSMKGIGLDRRRSAFVIACALGALSLTAGLKALFSLPRPPVYVLDPGAFAGEPIDGLLRSFAESTASASGYGFPSGHALGSTVVYGALAFVLTVGTSKKRWIGAGLLIALVSGSRVVLGVHYLVDVLVGIALGLAYLAGVTRVARGPNVTRAFALAVLVGIAALVVSVVTTDADPGTVGAVRDAVTLLGVSGGAGAGWVLVDGVPTPSSRDERLGTLVTGLVVASAPGILTYLLDPALPIELLAGIVVGAAAISTPLVAIIGARAIGAARPDQNA